jgi:hypothetical protein
MIEDFARSSCVEEFKSYLMKQKQGTCPVYAGFTPRPGGDGELFVA